MSLYVDNRVGSRHLAPLLAKLGAEPELTRLESADVVVTGNGPSAAPLSIAVEVKKIPDLLACINNGRFVGGQLPDLLHHDFSYLIVEGEFRTTKAGLEYRNRARGKWRTANRGHNRWTMAGIDHWLTTMTLVCGLHVVPTSSSQHTAEVIHHLHSWAAVAWEKHDACRDMDRSLQEALRQRVKKVKGGAKVALTMASPPPVAQVAVTFPGMGVDRALEAAEVFNSVSEMVNAEEKTWRLVKGVGKEVAKNVTGFVRRRRW